MSSEQARAQMRELLAGQRAQKDAPGAHEKCAAFGETDRYTLVCDQSLGHHAFLCRDSDHDETFHAPDRRMITRIRRTP